MSRLFQGDDAAGFSGLVGEAELEPAVADHAVRESDGEGRLDDRFDSDLERKGVRQRRISVVSDLERDVDDGWRDPGTGGPLEATGCGIDSGAGGIVFGGHEEPEKDGGIGGLSEDGEIDLAASFSEPAVERAEVGSEGITLEFDPNPGIGGRAHGAGPTPLRGAGMGAGLDEVGPGVGDDAFEPAPTGAESQGGLGLPPRG
jgi:hypothetical protein